MSKIDLPKNYDPRSSEAKWLDTWDKRGYFHADPNAPRPKYTIVIPPPNVTGVLHLGHALNNTMQDIMIRYKRMSGFETEWLPGIDHAGIATQVVVEKQIIKEGGTREGLGREKFLERVWDWKNKNGDTILRQLRLMGCSCDYARTRFTMDEGLSRAVLEVFTKLYEKGLIYKGTYIVNWCPSCLTTLSDDELEREEKDSNLWYIRYPLEDGKGYVVVPTTRPETMLGDTAVCVNPADKRHTKIIGKRAKLPLLGRSLPIIADSYIDMEFGTGAMKVTPAHDANDFELGRRYNLESIKVIDKEGKITAEGGPYVGLDRYEARKRIVKDLESQGLLEKIEPHKLGAAVCYRCGTIIEPFLSEQWFVDMARLAPPAIAAVKEGRIQFHPPHWSKVYLHWMENIRPWCISRQLWWGHRIPVWYKNNSTEIYVGANPPSADYRQDEDVLDTWFSSWLWPFSTFGWPEKTAELKAFYPTQSLFTASEIIFLWVARMVMAGCEFMNEIPFTDVYVHGTVRDEIGRKMSKSLGNGIDPIDIINQHGADAMRLSLVLAAPEGQDPNIGMNSFELGRNFANKLWNASRLVLSNQGDDPKPQTLALDVPGSKLHLADRWILSRLAAATEGVSSQLDGFRFNAASKSLYDFVWSEYCDWYLELVKPRFQKGSPDEQAVARAVSLHVLHNIVRLMHPAAPFVTEELWDTMRYLLTDAPEHVTIAPWPQGNQSHRDAKLDDEMQHAFDVIVAIRGIRSQMNIPPGKEIDCLVRVDTDILLTSLQHLEENIRVLAKIRNLTIGKSLKKPIPSATTVIRDAEIMIPLEGLIDLEAERRRIEKELKHNTEQLERINKKLQNADFLAKAPADVLAKENAKRDNFETMVQKLQANLEQLVGW